MLKIVLGQVVGAVGVGHIREHHQKAPVAVVDKPRVARQLDQAFHGRIVQAQIQNGVHHARHGELRAGAHRDQQGIGRIAQLLAGLFLHGGQSGFDLVHQAVGEIAAVFRVLVTRIGRDGKSGRDGQADIAHLGQVRALAAQFIPHRCVALFKEPHALGVCHSFLLCLLVALIICVVRCIHPFEWHDTFEFCVKCLVVLKNKSRHCRAI